MALQDAINGALKWKSDRWQTRRSKTQYDEMAQKMANGYKNILTPDEHSQIDAYFNNFGLKVSHDFHGLVKSFKTPPHAPNCRIAPISFLVQNLMCVTSPKSCMR